MARTGGRLVDQDRPARLNSPTPARARRGAGVRPLRTVGSARRHLVAAAPVAHLGRGAVDGAADHRRRRARHLKRQGRRLLGGGRRAAPGAIAVVRGPDRRRDRRSRALGLWPGRRRAAADPAPAAQRRPRADAQLADAQAAYDAHAAFEALAGETRSSIESTVQMLLRAYRSPRVQASAAGCQIIAERLLAGSQHAVPDRRRAPLAAAAPDLPGAAAGARRPRLPRGDAARRPA